LPIKIALVLQFEFFYTSFMSKQGSLSRQAPAHIRAGFDTVPKSQIERRESTDESDALAAQYIAEGVVGELSLDDCKHIAIATLAHADALVSWNFKHVINRRDGYNSVNERLGYPKIEILAPNQSEVNNEST